MKPVLLALTGITERSRKTRELYSTQCEKSARTVAHHSAFGCTYIAHAAAASPANDKLLVNAERQPNLGIVTAYDDMLSAHQPYQIFPEIIKQAARDAGATAHVAGGGGSNGMGNNSYRYKYDYCLYCMRYDYNCNILI